MRVGGLVRALLSNNHAGALLCKCRPSQAQHGP